MRNHRESYIGEYDAVVLVVGANNLGRYAVREAVIAVSETLEELSSLNPRACSFACEVGNVLAALLVL